MILKVLPQKCFDPIVYQDPRKIQVGCYSTVVKNMLQTDSNRQYLADRQHSLSNHLCGWRSKLPRCQKKMLSPRKNTMISLLSGLLMLK